MTRAEYRQALRKVRYQLQRRGFTASEAKELSQFWRPGEWVIEESYHPDDLPLRRRMGFVRACEYIMHGHANHRLTRWYDCGFVERTPANGLLWRIGRYVGESGSIGARLARGEAVAV